MEARGRHRPRRRLLAVGRPDKTCRAPAFVQWPFFPQKFFIILVPLLLPVARPPCRQELPCLMESFSPWAGEVLTHLGAISCTPSNMTRPSTLGPKSQLLILTTR